MNSEGLNPAQAARDDDFLLRRYAKDGSEEAFAEIVRRYMPLVYGVSVRELGSREPAEDACQVTCAALARKAGAIRGGGALASWLYRTSCLAARRIATQERRRREREKKWMEQGEIEVSGGGWREAGAWDEALWSPG